jgi:transposase-like protein
MRRVPPSTVAREQIQQLFTTASPEGTNILSQLALLGVQYLGQLGMEHEQADLLGRDHYQRAEQEPVGYRNGYEPAIVKTAEGPVSFRVPQVRGTQEPFRPKILDFILGNSEILEHLVVEMYARGLSTRDVEDCFRDEDGNPMISRSAVSEITDQLWEDYQQFCTRDLSGIELQYLFLDAVYESLRRYGAKEGVLAAWGTSADGRKQLLHLAVGNKESGACWTEFLRNMVGRGLRIPISVTADGAPGLINAIDQVFPHSLRVRCWYHKLGNINTKLPDEAKPEVLAHIRAVRDAPTYEAGQLAAAGVMERFGNLYPSAMKCFADDLEASLNHLRLPVRHRIHVRTTNLLERSFVEERRRTKVIPRLLDERSAMKLVFATLIRCSERWQRISINELERQQLRLLRRELGLDPPPSEGDPRAQTGRSAA